MKKARKMIAVALAVFVLCGSILPIAAQASSKTYWVTGGRCNPSGDMYVSYNKKKNTIKVTGKAYKCKSRTGGWGYNDKLTKIKKTYKISSKCKVECADENDYYNKYKSWKKSGKLYKDGKKKGHILTMKPCKRCFEAPCTRIKIKNNKVVAISVGC